MIFAISSPVVNEITSLYHERSEFDSGGMRIIYLTILCSESHSDYQPICTQKNPEQRDQQANLKA